MHLICVWDKTCFIPIAGLRLFMFIAGNPLSYHGANPIFFQPDHFHVSHYKQGYFAMRTGRFIDMQSIHSNRYLLSMPFQLRPFHSPFCVYRKLVLYWLSLWKVYFNRVSPTIFFIIITPSNIMVSQLLKQRPHEKALSIKFVF